MSKDIFQNIHSFRIHYHSWSILPFRNHSNILPPQDWHVSVHQSPQSYYQLLCFQYNSFLSHETAALFLRPKQQYKISIKNYFVNTFKLIIPNPFMYVMKLLNFSKTLTLSKYGVISGPYFHVFGLHTDLYEVNLHIESEYRKIRTRNNSVFGHFSRSVIGLLPLYNYTHTHVHIYLQEPGFAPHILLS